MSSRPCKFEDTWFAVESPNLRMGCEHCGWDFTYPGTDGQSHKRMRAICAWHAEGKNEWGR